jgi:Zn-dependent protease with chaperone function
VVKVIDVPQAWAGLHARAVLLVSRSALDLLTREEIQALAAHEAGHEYVWEEFILARDRNDGETLRRLELVCDTIAAATLQSIGVPAERLIAALKKMYQYNYARFGRPLNGNAYPSLAERQHVVERMTNEGYGFPRGRGWKADIR